MQAPLPAALATDGRADTLLTVYVADDVAEAADAGELEQVEVRLLLSDPQAGNGRSDDARSPDRLPPEVVVSQAHHLVNSPLLRETAEAVEVRINNGLLAKRDPVGGWLVFAARPRQLAVGRNLVGVRCAATRTRAEAAIVIEKLEVWVRYRRPG